MTPAEEALQKKGVAYHEAGHTIVSLHGSGDFSSVEIEKGSQDWKGKTAASYDKKDIKGKAQYFAGGTIAQARGAPGSSGLFQDQGDVNNLNKIADDNFGNPALIGTFASATDRKLRDDFKAGAKRDAKKIIDDHWDEVEKIAEALLKHGKLTKEDVDDLLKQE